MKPQTKPIFLMPSEPYMHNYQEAKLDKENNNTQDINLQFDHINIYKSLIQDIPFLFNPKFKFFVLLILWDGNLNNKPLFFIEPLCLSVNNTISADCKRVVHVPAKSNSYSIKAFTFCYNSLIRNVQKSLKTLLNKVEELLVFFSCYLKLIKRPNGQCKFYFDSNPFINQLLDCLKQISKAVVYFFNAEINFSGNLDLVNTIMRNKYGEFSISIFKK